MPPCLLVVIDRSGDARKLGEFFLHNACHLRAFVCWTGTSGLACQLRETPLTDGDVGHYICELRDCVLIVVTSVPAGQERKMI